MNWILEHLQVVLAIVGALAYWLKQRSESKAEKEDAASQPVQPSTVAEADDAERARRIREEILRKISARRGESAAPSSPMQTEERKLQMPSLGRPVSPLDPFGGPARPAMRRSSPVTEPPVLVKSQSEEAVLLRQERLAQQMRELEGQRVVAHRRAAATTEATRVADGISARAASAVREELRNPRTLRHAMILREVLSSPVGLR